MAEEEPEERMQYANKCEMFLTLVGWAVGTGNVWRFPYLTYQYGGGAFLIPYFISLLVLGIPMFTLELGMGQMFRQGAIGVWEKLNLPRLRGIGIAGTVISFTVSLYYVVIIAWALYFIGRTVGSVGSGVLPWSDQVPGFQCPEYALFPSTDIANNSDIHDENGIFNPAYAGKFWCPETGIPLIGDNASAGYQELVVSPKTCPSLAAVLFWENEVLQQSSGLTDFQGIHWGMFYAYCGAWLINYACVFRGVSSSGKVVYFTAVYPYVALTIFFFRAITLENAEAGLKFFLIPDFSRLAEIEVWQRAATQIFYSLALAFGALVAISSYNKKEDNFVKNASTVAIINCCTSVFAGLVIFPILGYLAQEMSVVNPCIQQDNLEDLKSIGLQGTGLVFIAFPIAVSQMPASYFFALVFFVMLLCLGIDSEFALIEGMITVCHDAGFGKNMPRELFAALICGVQFILGLVFVTNAGIYWFNLFDYYTCVIGLFFVAFLEAVALMWGESWPVFKGKVLEYTEVELGAYYYYTLKYVAPVTMLVLTILTLESFDLLNARESVEYPEGSGKYPEWSIWFGWFLGLLPVFGFLSMLFVTPPEKSEVEMNKSLTS